MPPRRQGEGQILDQQLVALGLAQTFDLDHLGSEAGAVGNDDLRRRDPLPLRGLGEFVVALDPGLLLGLPGARALADPFQLPGKGLLTGLVLTRFLLEAFRLLFEPGGIVPFPRDAAAAIELEDPAGDVVEEIAVMGDDQDRPLVGDQMVLEPGDRLGIEVVRRLVEQQHVRRLEQKPAEGDAPPLSPRESRHIGISGGQRSASIATSTCASRSHRFCASI
ncbi:hypothetical protein ruthe_01156 [Rubellimicrobium thermophilum DSM 16684]|uniref:Uncharacterized protein n=1 Tax=Rubellimicrobium thermophilum DSM 16684 TaxID=1123069 RepID=S9QY73_9RHOB|nr:hypothetical protein ruthe_01156 [Rubellimicrobium thermophilum DSM 16684]